MWPARFSSTRTPSTLTSVSNRSTFMTQGEACKIKSLKEIRDGFTRCSFTCLISSSRSQWSEVLYCVVPACQQHLRQEKGIAKKLIQTLRAIMISQEVDLVAGDFNGTAWRCRSRDNLSTIDEVFADCALPTPPGPTPLWRPRSIPNNWEEVCGFLNPPPALNVSGK